MPVLPTLSLLLVLAVYWLICRLYAWRATLSFSTFATFFTFGCVGSTMIALYLEAIPMPFAMQEGTLWQQVSPAAWLTGPAIEELAKILPLLVIVGFVPAARRLGIADFTLIGFSTGLGFGFVEDNFGRVLSSDLASLPWGHLWGFGWTVGTPQAQYLTYSSGHWVLPALVGLAFGIGVRLWPDRWLKWLPGAVMLVLVSFDHSMWNFKQLHQYPNSFALASPLAEWLYGFLLHGFLAIIALPLVLVTATFLESRWSRPALGAGDSLLLPGEHGWLGEPAVLFARLKLGLGPLSRTLTYFRHRRAFALAAADSARSPGDATAARYAALALERLRREHAQVSDPAASNGIPLLGKLKAVLLAGAERYWIVLLVIALGLLLFGIAPRTVPWLHSREFGWGLTVAAVAFTAWRSVRFWRAGAPDPAQSGGEELAFHRGRAMLLVAAAAATGISLAALAFDRSSLLPVAAASMLSYMRSYAHDWASQGGSPGNLTAVGGGAAAAPPPKKKKGKDSKEEEEKGAKDDAAW